jgi:hypothetical protein
MQLTIRSPHVITALLGSLLSVGVQAAPVTLNWVNTSTGTAELRYQTFAGVPTGSPPRGVTELLSAAGMSASVTLADDSVLAGPNISYSVNDASGAGRTPAATGAAVLVVASASILGYPISSGNPSTLDGPDLQVSVASNAYCSATRTCSISVNFTKDATNPLRYYGTLQIVGPNSTSPNESDNASVTLLQNGLGTVSSLTRVPANGLSGAYPALPSAGYWQVVTGNVPVPSSLLLLALGALGLGRLSRQKL